MRSLPLSCVPIALVFLLASPCHAAWGGFVENQGQTDPSVLYYSTITGASVYLTRDAIVFDLSSPEGESRARGAAVHMHFNRRPGATSPAARFPRVEPRDRLPGRIHCFLGADPARWRTDLSIFREIVYHELWPGTDLVLRSTGARIVYEVVNARTGHPGEAPDRGEGETPRLSDIFVSEGVEGTTRAGERILLHTEAGTLAHVLPQNGGSGCLEVAAVSSQPDADVDALSSVSSMEADPSLPAVSPAFSSARDNPDALLYGTFLGGSAIDWGNRGAVDADGCAVATGNTQSPNFPVTPGAYDVSRSAQDAFVAKLSSAGDSLLWCTFLGGSAMDDGRAVAIDASDHVIVTGNTLSTDFPTTTGAYDRTHNGSDDLFFVKLAPAGNALVWGSYVGGSSSDGVSSIALDEDGIAYVTGETVSTNFPTTAGAYDTSYNGGSDVFVLAFGAAGSSLVWSTVLGGSSNEYGWDVDLGPMGNPVISGYATDGNFPTTPGAYDRTYNGSDRDAFVARLSADGRTLMWSSFLGGSNWDWSYGVAMGDDDCPIAAGGTMSSDFPTTPGAYDVAFAVYDVFVTKFSDDGDSLRWSTFVGGSSSEEAYDVEIDDRGRPIVTGLVSSPDFPVTDDAFDGSFNSSSDVFLFKMSESGDQLLWSSYFGGASQERGWSVALEDGRDPVVFGHTQSSAFPSTPSAFDPTANGNFDAFVIKVHMQESSGIGDRHDTPAGQAIFACGPNPTLDGTTLRFRLPAGTPFAVRLLDVSGRVLAVLGSGRAEGSKERILWDGRDGRGLRVPAGAYLLQLDAGGDSEGRWVTVLR